MSYEQTPVATQAQLVGTLARLDIDTDPAYATIFDASDTALVSIVFAKPAGVVSAPGGVPQLLFTQNDPSGDLIINTGNAATFQLFASDNAILGEGTVTDMAGTGPLKISGSTGTTLYAGARAVLGELKMV